MAAHHQPDLFASAYGNEDPRVRLATERRAAMSEAGAIKRMARRKDRVTSVKAATVVRRASGTIRVAVEEFFKHRGPMGATDDEVRNHFGPDKPESSYRKRRTELAQDGVLLDSGMERGNSNGAMAIVWVHRDHAQPNAKRSSPVETRRSQREEILVKALRYASNLIGPDEIIDAALNGVGQ